MSYFSEQSHIDYKGGSEYSDSDVIEFGVFVINSSKKRKQQPYGTLIFQPYEGITYRKLIMKLNQSFPFLRDENYYLTCIGKVLFVFLFFYFLPNCKNCNTYRARSQNEEPKGAVKLVKGGNRPSFPIPGMFIQFTLGGAPSLGYGPDTYNCFHKTNIHPCMKSEILTLKVINKVNCFSNF